MPKKEDGLSETREVIEHVVITYEDGYTALYDAIYITDKEVVFGKLSDKDGFEKHGGIPKENIKTIEGHTTRTLYKNKEKL